MKKCLLAAVGVLFLLARSAFAQQPIGGQGGFVPVGPGAVVEQLPAAPLLIAAYAFVWIALMLYLWSIWRRLGKLEADMQALAERRARPGRSQ